MNQKIACCSTLNDFYFDGFLTFFFSLRRTTPSFNYPYYIFTWGELSAENIELLHSIYPHFIIKQIDNEQYKGCEYNTKWRTWDINCINRFEIFTLEEYDRVIFFDADMIVQEDISELFNIDVEFGACEITKGSDLDHPSAFDKNIKSFDGGLMSISKKYLNLQVRHDLIQTALKKKWSSDEPILNVYFNNDITTFLPKKYNLLSTELTPENIKTAKIIQFVGAKKPWFPGTMFDRYDEYVFKQIPNKQFLFKVDQMYRQQYISALKAYGR